MDTLPHFYHGIGIVITGFKFLFDLLAINLEVLVNIEDLVHIFGGADVLEDCGDVDTLVEQGFVFGLLHL